MTRLPPLSIEELIAAAVEKQQRPLVEEIRALRATIEARDVAQYINQTELGHWLGIKSSALSMRLKRGGELASLARTVDGRRVWSRADVEALLARSAK